MILYIFSAILLILHASGGLFWVREDQEFGGFEIPIPKLRWKLIGWGREEQMVGKSIKACWKRQGGGSAIRFCDFVVLHFWYKVSLVDRFKKLVTQYLVFLCVDSLIFYEIG
jgi:hypothetical protein